MSITIVDDLKTLEQAEQILNTITPEQSIHEVKYVTLRDGRKLAYSEFGATNGKPVLYCHGNPGSRLDLGLFGEEVMQQYGLRMIAPDRPGIGQSDFLRGRRIVDWPADAAELADSLRISQFSVLGLSCGGPFAAVTAYALPKRVTKLVLVSSLGLGKEIAFWIRYTAHKSLCRYLGKTALNLLEAMKWLFKHLFLPFNLTLPFSETSLSLGSDMTNFRAQKTVFFDRLAELSMPTLLVWGSRDPVVPFQQAYAAGCVRLW